MSFNKVKFMREVLAIVVSCLTIAAAVWLFAKPAIRDAVADELKEDIEQTVRTVVQDEIAPVKGDLTNLSGSFRVILIRDISALRRQIAREEARRQEASIPGSQVVWTPDDAEDLTNLRIELEGLQMALDVMNESH